MSQLVRYRPRHPLIVVVGNYGSGKTEVAVNLALFLAGPAPVRIVDLDVVNPYFRCREAREEMEAAGVEVVVPRGELRSADLPIILPEIRGAIARSEGYTILDVGGDDVGARALSSLSAPIRARPHQVLQVVNSRRPFTGDVAGCRRMKAELEAAGRLAITGVVSNTHLIEETSVATIREGLVLARAFAAEEALSLEFATAPEELLPALADEDVPFLTIRRRMLKPWELGRKTDHAGWLLDHVN